MICITIAIDDNTMKIHHSSSFPFSVGIELRALFFTTQNELENVKWNGVFGHGALRMCLQLPFAIDFFFLSKYGSYQFSFRLSAWETCAIGFLRIHQSIWISRNAWLRQEFSEASNRKIATNGQRGQRGSRYKQDSFKVVNDKKN